MRSSCKINTMLIPCIHIRMQDLLSLYRKQYPSSTLPTPEFVLAYLKTEETLVTTTETIDVAILCKHLFHHSDFSIDHCTRLFVIDTQWLGRCLSSETTKPESKLCGSCYRVFCGVNGGTSVNAMNKPKRTHPLANVHNPHT